MSEERLDELGIPRRRFLKKTAAAAFVAPVVVSFAIDGVAEGDTRTGKDPVYAHHHCANQTFPNQLQIENDLLSIVEDAVYSIPPCALDEKTASTIASLALTAALAAASDSKNMCDSIAALIHELHKLPQGGVRSQMLHYAKQARFAAGCPT